MPALCGRGSRRGRTRAPQPDPGPGRGRDEGGAAAVEFILIMLIFVMLFMMVLAFAVQAYAHRVAETAAEDGLSAATTYHGDSDAGRAAARRSLDHTGGGLEGTSVSVTRGADTASVTVTGHAPQLLPLVPTRVSVTVRGPVERFVEDTR